jgi:hypothetical protein
MLPEVKKPYLSKTLWMNLITAAFAIFYAPAKEWISANPQIVVGALTGLNFLLRLVTKDKVGLQD